jgi:hypothetical protein
MKQSMLSQPSIIVKILGNTKVAMTTTFSSRPFSTSRLSNMGKRFIHIGCTNGNGKKMWYAENTAKI